MAAGTDFTALAGVRRLAHVLGSRGVARVLLATQSPAIPGGVLTMVQAYARVVRAAGVEVALVYLASAHNDPLNRFGGRRRRKRPELLDALRGVCIGSGLAPIASLKYGACVSAWLSEIRSGDLLQSITGPPAAGYAYACQPREYFCWSAVGIDEDLKGRCEGFSLLKKCAYRMMLPQMRRDEGTILRGAAHVFCLSPDTLRDLSGRYRLKATNASVLPCYVDTECFRPGGTCTAHPRVVAAGRMEDGRKDLPTLLAAFAAIRHEFPRAELCLAGAKRSSGLDSHVRALGLPPDCVRPLGWLRPEELVGIHRTAWAYIQSSRQEGLGIAALEAMACGLPIVSTDCGGPRAYVRDRVNGRLVPVGDSEAIARATVEIIASKTYRAELARNARRTVLDSFSADSFAAHLAEIYDRRLPGGT